MSKQVVGSLHEVPTSPEGRAGYPMARIVLIITSLALLYVISSLMTSDQCPAVGRLVRGDLGGQWIIVEPLDSAADEASWMPRKLGLEIESQSVANAATPDSGTLDLRDGVQWEGWITRSSDAKHRIRLLWRGSGSSSGFFIEVDEGEGRS